MKDKKTYIICHLESVIDTLNVIAIISKKTTSPLIVVSNHASEISSNHHVFHKVDLVDNDLLFVNDNFSSIFNHPIDRVYIFDGLLDNNKTTLKFFIMKLLSDNLAHVYKIDRLGREQPLKIDHVDDSDTLFIFPERMLPLSRAFFVRGFDLMSTLNIKGKPVDTLVFGPNNNDLPLIKSCLEIFSPTVTVRALQRSPYSKTQKAIRYVEKKYRSFHHQHHHAVIKFSERETLFSSREILDGCIEAIQKKPYKNIIITGAWFHIIAREITNIFPDIRVICDTHDVFFKLDEDSNKNEHRFLYSPIREKRREINALNSMHRVICISKSDYNNLSSYIDKSKLIIEGGCFEHVSRNIKNVKVNNKNRMSFGFVGSSNKNNQKCMEEIISNWWPKIVSNCVEANLFIAGSICNTEIANSAIQKYDNIKLDGFVSDISNFYQKIDVVLSPIMVQGGLNFKSVEALISGKILLTNSIGVMCVDGMIGAYNIDAENFELIFNDIVKAINTPNISEEIVLGAKKLYGMNNAYNDLISYIN